MSELNQNQRELPVNESEELITEETEAVEPKEVAEAAEAEESTEVCESAETADAESAEPVSPDEPVKKDAAKARRPLNWKKEAVDYMEILVFAIGFVLLLFSFLFRICTVEGASMENTLYETESLVVSDLFYEPKQGDIVVFHQSGGMGGAYALNEPVVKRVIAVEGETVFLQYREDSMTVTVTHTDGTKTVLEEAYVKYEKPLAYYAPAKYTVPEGHIFVLGDNRNNSADSRSTLIGMVDTRRILGKVLFRISPMNRFGAVE